jgi:hypothetical protein
VTDRIESDLSAGSRITFEPFVLASIFIRRVTP